MTGKAVIVQGGGPNRVMNACMVAITRRLAQSGFEVYGAKQGLLGVARNDFFNLHMAPDFKLERVARTPGAALGSSRKKLTEAEIGSVLKQFETMGVKQLFVIGGIDSAATAKNVYEAARARHISLIVYHIPATVDNDLNADHCLGYGSAAKFVAEAAMGTNMDNIALPGVYLMVVMGRYSGWLTAASALGRTYADDGPHLIYLPEREFKSEQFVEDVRKVVRRLGRAHVAVAEGIWTKAEGVDKSLLEVAAGQARASLEQDAFGNTAVFSGTGLLADYLVELIKRELRTGRVRADTLGYPQRSYPGTVSQTDLEEALMSGEMAARYALQGNHDSGSVVLVRIADSTRYKTETRIVPLDEVANKRAFPEKFIARKGTNVTDGFFRYALPLVGQLPEMERL